MTDLLQIESQIVWDRLTAPDHRTGQRLADDPTVYVQMAKLVAQFYVHRRRHFEPEIGEAWHPENWRETLRERYSGLSGAFDFEAGWCDIMSAGAAIVADAGETLKISYAKEKYGSMSLFSSSYFDGELDLVDSCMEALSVHICECCGAPGINRAVRGWWRTECDHHHAIREAGR
ncbi:hypothetical protein [Devosia sp. Leaf64]|uniref:hypothetical protein n=1 Tax=Devosia sp. Leaf64 TaxID=1736229 RepID=UPI0007887591|nr:hypothetical protein [Devosia sp. Leaf64]